MEIKDLPLVFPFFLLFSFFFLNFCLSFYPSYIILLSSLSKKTCSFDLMMMSKLLGFFCYLLFCTHTVWFVCVQAVWICAWIKMEEGGRIIVWYCQCHTARNIVVLFILLCAALLFQKKDEIYIYLSPSLLLFDRVDRWPGLVTSEAQQEKRKENTSNQPIFYTEEGR